MDRNRQFDGPIIFPPIILLPCPLRLAQRILSTPQPLWLSKVTISSVCAGRSPRCSPARLDSEVAEGQYSELVQFQIVVVLARTVGASCSVRLARTDRRQMTGGALGGTPRGFQRQARARGGCSVVLESWVAWRPSPILGHMRACVPLDMQLGESNCSRRGGSFEDGG
jgi:hypothetical protein